MSPRVSLRSARLAALSVALLLLVSITACTESAPADVTDPPDSNATTSPADVSGTASGTADPSEAPTLPATCADILPTVDVDKALGKQLDGKTLYIEGEPEPDIGRLGRVTCSYGTKAGQKKVPVQATYFLYESADDAKARIDSAVNGTRAAGNKTTEVKVGSLPATLLLEPGQVILVLANDATTYSITVQGTAMAAVNRGKTQQAVQAMAKVMVATVTG